MHARTFFLTFIAGSALLFAGCATPMAQRALPPEHPASPLAAESPSDQGSRTLSLNDVLLPAPADKNSATEMHPEMHGMKHSMHGMQHDTPGTRPGTNADISAPRWTPTSIPSTAAVTYTCPMHKDVVSSQPGTCPKCGMKLVPKAPATQSVGAGSEKPAGHVHDHGAHE